MNPTPTRSRPALRSWRLPGATLCALALAAASPGVAAQAAGGHAGHGAAPAAASAEWAEAEVRRIDAANGRVTLRHGPIRSLDMPPMTMVFQARDPAQLSGLKNGDRIRFQAVSEGGKYLLTQVEKQP
jgi:Cu(I)/Ag(I) efflux system protein CusF